MVKVKICGVTRLEDALFCVESGADALGFIFWRKSPRYINPRKAKKIISKLSPFVTTVGVFVNEPKSKVSAVANYLNLGALQFHGGESYPYCSYFLPRFRVIKTFFPPQFPGVDYSRLDNYLFDIKWEDKIGKKTVLSSASLKRISKIKNKAVIISGGLTPQNVSALVNSIKPYAVDVSSGVESSPGEKDKRKVESFIQRAKK